MFLHIFQKNQFHDLTRHRGEAVKLIVTKLITNLNLIKVANVFGFIEEEMKKEGTIIISIITTNGA